MIVIDASAMLALLLRTPAAPSVEEHVLKAGVLGAPHLLDLEVANVLRGYCEAGEMSRERASEALKDLRTLRIYRYAQEPLLTRIWELQEHTTTYDAVYLALAEALKVPLLTCDVRLKEVSELRAKVVVA